MVRYSNTKFHP